MAKGSRGGKRAVNNIKINGIKDEDVLLSFPPTPLNKNGQPVVIKESDGSYKYVHGFEDFKGQIDTNSSDYKRAKNTFNMKMNFMKDGSIKVRDGVFSSRAKTFKDADSFSKEVNKKFDAYIKYYEDRVNRLRKGHLLYADLDLSKIKTIVRSNPSSQAIKRIGEMFKDNIKSELTYKKAAESMKETFNLFMYNKFKISH